MCLALPVLVKLCMLCMLWLAQPGSTLNEQNRSQGHARASYIYTSLQCLADEFSQYGAAKAARLQCAPHGLPGCTAATTVVVVVLQT